MASLSDKAGFLIAANLIKYTVGFLMPVFMVRLISQQDYGTYQQLLLVGSVSLGLLSFGLPTSVYYFYGRADAKRRIALTFQTLVMLGIAGVLAVGVIAGCAPLIAQRMNNPAVQVLLPLYAVSIGLMLASEHFTSFMIARDHYRTAVLFESLETIVRVFTLILPVILGFGLQGVVVAAVLYAAVRFIVRTLWLVRTGNDRLSGLNRNALFPKEQLAYCFPLAMGSVVSAFGGMLDRAIVASSFSTVEYAIYAVGALEIPIDVIFQASVANVMRAALPTLIKDGKLEEVVRLLHEAVRKLALIVIPTFVFLLGHASEFITLLFTDQYAMSANVFRIYLFLVPLHMFVLSPVPQAFGKTKLNLQIIIAFTVCNVVLSYLLLSWIGFYGPAIAMVASCYFSSAIFFFVVRRLTQSSALRLLPVRAILKTVLCALCGLGAAWVVGSAFASKSLNFSIHAGVFSIVYISSGILFRLFTEQDRLLAKRWAAKFRVG